MVEGKAIMVIIRVCTCQIYGGNLYSNQQKYNSYSMSQVSEPIPFKVSTEEENTYSLIILSNGGDFAAFLKNPVLLKNHLDNEVYGWWENLRVEGTEIFADAVFDLEDPEAARIHGKVVRKVLRATSISIRVLEAYQDLRDGRKVIVVSKWELREISIVTIPSNRSALRLVDADNKSIQLGDVIKLTDILPETQILTTQKQSSGMENKTLAARLGLAETATDAEIEVALSDKLKAANDLDALQLKLQNDQEQEAISLADAAIKDKRLSASLKDQFLKLAKTDFALFKSTLASLAAPVSLTGFANNGASALDALLNDDDKAIKLYDKLDREGGLMKLKNEKPEDFKRIYKAKHGVEYPM